MDAPAARTLHPLEDPRFREALARMVRRRVPLETPAVTATLADLVDYLLFVGETPMPGGLRGS